jgi:hypothetical protein
MKQLDSAKFVANHWNLLFKGHLRTERRSMVRTLLLKVINKNFPTIITYKILSFSLQKLLKQTLFGTRYIPHRSQTVKIRRIT